MVGIGLSLSFFELSLVFFRLPLSAGGFAVKPGRFE